MLDYLGNKENIFEIKINTNATFLTEKIAHSIFKNKVIPNKENIDEHLAGNLCRCTGYDKIVRAVQDSAQRIKAGG